MTNIGRKALLGLLLVFSGCSQSHQGNKNSNSSNNWQNFLAVALKTLEDTSKMYSEHNNVKESNAANNNLYANASSPQPYYNARVIESRIDGEFKGWEGETIFKLQNGQIWQQASYDYYYDYQYYPKIMIYADGCRYYMLVKGIRNKAIEVRRIY